VSRVACAPVITRRAAVLTGASGLFAAGCGGRAARTLAGDPKDLRVLAAALEVERAQIAFYEAGVRLSAVPVVKTILAQERAHAAAISEAIRELGGTPAAARPLARFSLARGFDAWRQDAISREEQWSAGYAALIPKLANHQLRATFGALMATEAEHAVALDVAA
jgi:rubrerythrin